MIAYRQMIAGMEAIMNFKITATRRPNGMSMSVTTVRCGWPGRGGRLIIAGYLNESNRVMTRHFTQLRICLDCA